MVDNDLLVPSWFCSIGHVALLQDKVVFDVAHTQSDRSVRNRNYTDDVLTSVLACQLDARNGSARNSWSFRSSLDAVRRNNRHDNVWNDAVVQRRQAVGRARQGLLRRQDSSIQLLFHACVGQCSL